ncbi:MAG: beta-glucoside-specific PTS transporter subunit IIABC [Schleiferilactobacillus harbinensis]|jgi:PTS system beta-glucosides-specific IIC component|nr:beta-glucoside-specific PTS transporter subunit IIABC [Schleiferilactobacillus harbinensis]MCI1911457.1 beta-glucoside-specific PTS transporter subunit IIABC [Schleiferilactobacillus harbinensis]
MTTSNMAQNILTAVGGQKNVQSLIHCSTRLRFVLKDEKSINDDQVKAIDGVLSVARAGGQYQVVVGTNVADVYDDILKIGNLGIDDPSLQNALTEKKKITPASIFNGIIKAITGTIAPVIPIMAGAGMGKVLLLVLTLTGLISDKSQTYILLNLIFDTGFFFLPGFVGFSAAKIFGANQYLGAFVGLATLHPAWTALVAAKAPINFLGANVSLVSYSAQIIPALLSVWLMSYVEKWVKKITPQSIAVFFEPMMVMLITLPLTFVVIGPAGNLVSEGVANASLWMYNNVGWLAIPVLAALYPWLVSMGVHKALSPISIMLVAQQGFDPIIRVVALCSNISQAAASLAVGLKTKNKKLRSLALSSSITAYLGGITEPALYGVNLKLKKPMYGAMIGAASAGVVAGLLKMKAFIYVTPGLLSLPMWLSKTENYIPQAIATLLISSIVTFVATWIIGFDDQPDSIKVAEQPNSVENLSNQNVSSGSTVSLNTPVPLMVPVSGKVHPLADVNDPTFSSGIMGKGIAIDPNSDQIVSPVNGKIVATFETGHAIGIDDTENGIQLLIHIGIDTVSLKGKYFENLVTKGDAVTVGQPLIHFSPAKIKEAGLDPVVMLIVTNSDHFNNVQPQPIADAAIGQTAIMVQ